MMWCSPLISHKIGFEEPILCQLPPRGSGCACGAGGYKSVGQVMAIRASMASWSVRAAGVEAAL